MKIHHAQNPGRVLISRKQILLILLGHIFDCFFHWPENKKMLFHVFAFYGQYAALAASHP